MGGEEVALRVVDEEIHLLGLLLVRHLGDEGVRRLHVISIRKAQVVIARLQVLVDVLARRRSQHQGQEGHHSEYVVSLHCALF